MAKPELQHPALHHLRVTPDIILELMEGLGEEHTQEKADLTSYSLAEFLEYLSHREAHGFRDWLDRILANADAKLPPYDRAGLFEKGVYSGREPEESIAHWEERREDNLDVIEGLAPSALTPALDALLREWAAHDLMAIRQIAEYAGTYLYSPVRIR